MTFCFDENITPIAKAVEDYLQELDFDSKLQKVAYVQELLYEWLPTIPILYPQGHWAWSDDVTGISSLLITQSSQEWDQVYRTGFNYNNDEIDCLDCEPIRDNSGIVILIMVGFIGTIAFIVITLIDRNRKSLGKEIKSRTIKLTKSEKTISVEIVCIPCGRRNPSGSNYCEECGTNLQE